MANYTFTKKVAPVEPGQLSNFGGITVDANRVAMTGATASGPQTSDATGTPLTSPLTVSNSAVTTVNVPLNAYKVTLITATNTLNISEADSTVASKYFTLPVGTVLEIETAQCSVLYLKANTGSATVSFFFSVV